MMICPYVSWWGNSAVEVKESGFSLIGNVMHIRLLTSSKRLLGIQYVQYEWPHKVYIQD